MVPQGCTAMEEGPGRPCIREARFETTRFPMPPHTHQNGAVFGLGPLSMVLCFNHFSCLLLLLLVRM